MRITPVSSADERAAVFPVLQQLRDHLNRESFEKQYESMAEEGYQLFAGYVNDEPIAVAGVTISTNFYLGRHAYVYDLVAMRIIARKGTERNFSNTFTTGPRTTIAWLSSSSRDSGAKMRTDSISTSTTKNTATHLNMTSSNNQTDLCYASATALAADIRRGERSPVAVVDAFLDRIERVNPEINAYVTVCSESAREAAREAERAVERGDDIGPLHGVPVAIRI